MKKTLKEILEDDMCIVDLRFELLENLDLNQFQDLDGDISISDNNDKEKCAVITTKEVDRAIRILIQDIMEKLEKE